MAATQSIGGMFLVGARHVPGGRTCLRLKAGDTWRDVSWEEAERATREIALGLLELGLRPGQRVAVLAEGSPATAWLGLATTAVRGACALLWPDTPLALLPELVRHTEARVVALSSQRQAEAVREQLDRYPGVAHFLVPDPRFEADGERFVLVETLRERGRASALDDVLQSRLADARLDDPALVFAKRSNVLPPRLVRLTNGNVLAATEGAVAALALEADDQLLVAPPFADPVAWSAGLLAPIHARVPVAFAAGQDLLADLGDVSPTVLLATGTDVRDLAARLRGAPGDDRRAKAVDDAAALAARVTDLSRRGAAPSALLRLRRALVERRVLRALRTEVGGALRRVVSWGAPPPPAAARLFDALGVDFLDAYSVAEAGGWVATSTAGASSPLARSLGSTELAVGRGGRLRVRGPAIAAGAAGSTPDGWFEPGDLADAGSPPRLLGRADETVTTNDGAFVPLGALAARLSEQAVVRHSAVFRADGRSGLCVVCEPDHGALEAWGVARRLVTLPHEDMLQRPDEQDLFRSLLVALDADLPPECRVVELWLSPEHWTVDEGLLSPAGAVVRAAVLAHRDRCIPVPLPER